MTFYCVSDPIPGQCGAMLLHNINDWCYNNSKSLRFWKRQYKGYMIVMTFNQWQEEEYKACCKTFKWLGQSVPIQNPNSSNKIFTVIFKA